MMSPFPRASAALACLVLAAGLSAQVPIELQNANALQSSQQLVAVSIPLARGSGLYDGDALPFSLTDAQGRPQATQWTVLARWDGPRDSLAHEIKWVRGAAVMDVSAAPSSTIGVIGGAPPVGNGIVIRSVGDRVTISPRPGADFVLPTNRLSLFERISIDGVERLAGTGGHVGFRDAYGALVTPGAATTVVERSGPVETIVRQSASLGALNLTVRYTFVAGRDEVTLDVRLENPAAFGLFRGAPDGAVHFESLSLNFPVAAGLTQVRGGGAVENVAGGFVLEQGFDPARAQLDDRITGFNWTEYADGDLKANGGRHDGSLAVAGPRGGLTLGVRRFWQNFPKAYRVDAGSVAVDLWPQGGYGPVYRGQYGNASSPAIDTDSTRVYRLCGGRWKSHRVRLAFSSALPSASETRSSKLFLEDPVAARIDPLYTKLTCAIPALFSEKRNWSDPALQRIERLATLVGSDTGADLQRDGTQIGIPQWRRRGGLYGGIDMFGWANFGDISWGSGFCSLHYDYPLHAMLDWARGGEYSSRREGESLTEHLRDFDVNHGSGDAWAGAAFYEKGITHGNYIKGAPSHTWVHGILLHYVLTGDEGSYETGRTVANYFRDNADLNWDGKWGARVLGWPIEGLVAAHAYLGDPSYIVAARGIIGAFENREQIDGGRGAAWNAGMNPTQANPWMHAVVFNGVANYFVHTEDRSVLPLLDRMRGFFRTVAIERPGHGTNQRTLPFIWEKVLDDPSRGPLGAGRQKVALTWSMVEAFSWAFLLFEDPADAEMAMDLGAALGRHHQGVASQSLELNDPQAWSKISFRMLTYPGSESKTLGKCLHWAHSLGLITSVVRGEYYFAGPRTTQTR